MSFLSPEFFWLFLVLLLMFWYRSSRGEFSLAKSTRVKLVFLYVSLVLMILALSRPVLELKPIKQDFAGSEVVLALDLSYSMQAKDIKPNRLEAAKMFIKDLIKKRTHERFALLGFTTNAIILSPLTSDEELLGHQLDLISSELVITKGTKIASVLELSTRLSSIKEKNLIIIGDGGDSDDFSSEITYAKKMGLSISVVMMATQRGSKLQDKYGKWLKDSSDHLVISSSNDKIKSLVNATNGVYVDEDGLNDISSWLDSKDKKLSSVDLLMHQELFYYPLFLALAFFILGVTSLLKHISRLFLVLIALIGINLNADMREFTTESSGDDVYVEQRYLDELALYKKRAFVSPEDHYNLGNAYYKAGQYEDAINTYNEIFSTNASLKAKVFHNLGNAYVRIEMYEKARVSYKKSLILKFDKETDANLLHILNANKNEGLQTGQQKGKKRNESKNAKDASKKNGQKKKGGGSSNMKVTAQAGSGSKNKGKKTKNEGQVQFNNKQSGLSYKQYELINEGVNNEEHPW